MDQDLLSFFPSETAPPVQSEQRRVKPASSANGTNVRVRPPIDKMHALEQNVQFLKARSHARAPSEAHRNAYFVNADEAMASRDMPAGPVTVPQTRVLVVALIAITLLAIGVGRFLPAADRSTETQTVSLPSQSPPTTNMAESAVAQGVAPAEIRIQSANTTSEPALAQRISPPESNPPAQADPANTPPAKMIFKGHLVVDSVPTGATVLINQRPAGTTPLHLADYPAGSYAVWVDLAGYERWTAGVRVQANKTTNIRPLLSASAPTRQGDSE